MWFHQFDSLATGSAPAAKKASEELGLVVFAEASDVPSDPVSQTGGLNVGQLLHLLLVVLVIVCEVFWEPLHELDRDPLDVRLSYASHIYGSFR